jgi:serine/threonine protein kinase
MFLMSQLGFKKKFFFSIQDVKSANVLLDAYLRAKLADLGLAKVCHPTSDSSTGKRRRPTSVYVCTFN